MFPANERRRYNATSSHIGWAHAHNNPCIIRIDWIMPGKTAADFPRNRATHSVLNTRQVRTLDHKCIHVMALTICWIYAQLETLKYNNKQITSNTVLVLSAKYRAVCEIWTQNAADMLKITETRRGKYPAISGNLAVEHIRDYRLVRLPCRLMLTRYYQSVPLRFSYLQYNPRCPAKFCMSLFHGHALYFNKSIVLIYQCFLLMIMENHFFKSYFILTPRYCVEGFSIIDHRYLNLDLNINDLKGLRGPMKDDSYAI